jgi:hypothetical protein
MLLANLLIAFEETQTNRHPKSMALRCSWSIHKHMESDARRAKRRSITLRV